MNPSFVSQRLGLLTRGMQMALSMALAMGLSAPLVAAQAVELEATSVAEPFATEEWKHQQKHQRSEIGPATRGWLQTQGSRDQASPHRPTLSGPALRRVNERYLKSFEAEIPQQLRESLPSNK